ncbi:hypothetical protein pipiens_005213 [Culex pipiens pipiens]|uniref:Peptidase S1 domain-containing protein n=1 Tax=Culex pipiens pipiens TaxID=38569 RepID=A0ABD1DYN0_CULPP
MNFALLLLAIPLIAGSSIFQCGVPKVKINEVIVRGRDATPGSFPWHAAVYHRKGRSDSYACGGTLVSSMFVLTADHCVKDANGYVQSSKRIFAWLGVHNLNVPNLQTSQHHDIFKIHRFTESQQKKNDIALLELSTEAVFNQHVQPACINREEEVTGQSGVAVGWGFTEDDDVSPTLQAARMPVVSTTTCLEHDRDTFGQTLDSSLFCAGYTNGTTVCNVDSGDGLHVKRGDAWYVVGIVSFTAQREVESLLCKKDSYAAFTNVATFVPWIRNVTELLSLAEKDHIQPICLPVTQALREQKLQRYIVIGFGLPNFRYDRYNMTIGEGYLCAGSVEDGHDTCTSDSGGPLGYPVRYNGVRFVQYGVTAYGRACGIGASVYTNVANMMDWILANMQA